jgi:hypothetical protein
MAEGGAVDTAPGVSAAYRKAMQAGGQQTVNDYYANLRKDAEAYLANPNAPRGVEAYNVLLQSGISTSDLINAGVGQAVLDKIFAVQAPIKQEQFITPAGMTSAYERSPDLAFESQRLTALGQDGRAILDKQGRDYIANLQQGGIDATERAQMLEYATERGYSFDDLMKAGVDPNVLFTQPAAAAAPLPLPLPLPLPPPPMPGSALAPPVFPQTQPTYTPPQVYQPLPTQPDIFAAGQPALDVAFRESSPRTAIPGMPGQFDYSPAAKLRPATGAGFTWTPPSVTSRPRSLLSPREIQAYGGMTSKSQQFAQNRAAIDRNLRRLQAASPALSNPSTYALLRNRIMAQDFGDPQRVFDPKTGEVNLTTEEGQSFLKAVNALTASAPAGQAVKKEVAAGTGTTDVDQTDGSVIRGGSTTQAGGYAAAIEPGPITYGGYDVFAKGGLVKKSKGSAKDELARFANGGEADAELLRRQLENIDNTPTARTPERAPTPEQTESRTMLERLGRFASLDTPQDMGLGETAADIGMGFLPVVGTAQGARDFERARRDEDKLGMLLSAASMIPVAGGAVRAVRSAGKASRAADDLAALTAQVPTDIPQPNAALDMPPLENAQRTQLGTSTIPSYAKAQKILFNKKKILDFGAGRGQGASLIGADTFEPYPREGFNPSFSNVADIPSGSYDGLTSLNVLNVMPREVRDNAVRNIGRILADDGEAVITTRGRDVMTAKGVDGPEPMSRITTADTYQKGFTQQELTDYVSNVLGENFVVGSLPQKIGAAGVLVKKTKASNNTVSTAGEAGQMLDALTAKAQTETPEFKNFFGESKVVDAKGKPLIVYRGLNTSSEEALNVGERKSYANFASSSPHVASSYANPDEPFDSGGPVLPLYIKADKLIEFPVKVSTYDGARRFDKFEFDRRAKALNPGEVLVARQVYDIGPRASVKADPERLYSYPSDIYAWNKGVSVKSAIGNEGTFDPTNPVITKAKGGAVTKNNVERMRNDNRRYLG